jgi:hypothetical protein
VPQGALLPDYADEIKDGETGDDSGQWQGRRERSLAAPAIRRIGRPAAVARRATRRVATRQMPQAYPPQRGSGKRAAKKGKDSFAGG